tara:strand:- start:51 stop:383 length:333 start_codon:yes stop_codon:yes gene_type:complete
LTTKNLDTLSRAETDQIFKKIAQKTMNREKHVQLAYADPNAKRDYKHKGFNDDKRLNRTAKSALKKLSDELNGERSKREAVERELKNIMNNVPYNIGVSQKDNSYMHAST